MMKQKFWVLLLAALLLLGALSVSAATENATVVQEWNISLGDDIGANFYLKVPEEIADTAQVKVTVAGQTETLELPAPNEKGLYHVRVDVAAAQMTEDITLQLVAGETEYTPVSYTVREYAEYILEGQYTDKVKTLVMHMLDYGTAAQNYFGILTGKPANDGYELEYQAQYPESYPKMTASGQAGDLKLQGASLVMDSRVAVRYYFAATSLEGITFRVGDKPYDAQKKGELYYVEVPGILPDAYDEAILLTAEKAEQTLEVTYSPLTYMVRMSQNGRDTLKALVNAMYGYHKAAVAYGTPTGTVTLPTVTGGTVTADKESYSIGDTVTLTVAADEGYSQKLYVNGEPLLLDWKTNTYSFVATEEIYNITGSFEPSLNAVPSDGNRWDAANQAHGILNTYYPANDDSWWMDIKGEYRSVTVKAKNYLPVADSQDGNGNVGFAVILRVTMDNGKIYAFRVINDKGTYAYDRYGSGGSATGWGGWKALDAAAVAAIGADGVPFKLERTAGNKLTLSVNGTEMETYTMDGITAANKVVSVSIQHNGNKGQKVTVPYELEVPSGAPAVQLNIAALTGGTVTPELEQYQVGDTVTLSVAADEGYSQKLYVNGEPLLLDWKTNTYSFVATEEIYNIAGSFEPSLNMAPSDGNRWDAANQAHGILNTYYPANDDSWWMDIKGEYRSVTVKAKNYLPVADSQDGNGKVGFCLALRVAMDNGKTYAFRVYNDKGTYAYSRSGASGSASGWSGWKALDAAAVAAIGADGVPFKLERTAGNTLTLSVNGIVLDTYTMDGVTEANKVVSMGFSHYGNKGQSIAIPFALTEPLVVQPVTLTLPTFENGTVTADQESYLVGDTVTLTVTPNEGYSQKLTINGEALLLGWKTNTYSFTATETAYTVAGSFEPSLTTAPSDGNRWDAANQAHGILNTYYPANDDSWWMDIKGEYASIAVNAKNYLPTADSQDGNGKVGFCVTLRVTMDNGKTYAFRVYNDKGTYAYSRSGASGSASGWSSWKALDDAAAAAIALNGVPFQLERTAGNTLTLCVNGIVLDTYTIDGVTEANKVVSMGISHFGNKGEQVMLPFVLSRAPIDENAPFQTAELSSYVIVYPNGDTDYADLANQLKTEIGQKYGVELNVVSDSAALPADHEILVGDTNRYTDISSVMAYKVTVADGHFRIHAGGPCSAQNAVNYLCRQVFNGQAFSLQNGTHYETSLLTVTRDITSGTTVRVMSANVLADAFSDAAAYQKAAYRAEILAGMLAAYTPDVVGMQEVDESWSLVLDSYLQKLEKTQGIRYARYWSTYENKTNYTSLLYRSDKLKVENGGVEVFTWWKDLGANNPYHMRNISWARFSLLENSAKKFIVANTHWSYRTEHDDGNTYLTGSSTPIATNELRTQCKNETSSFMASLHTAYADYPIFLTGDFNTSLPYFTQYGWTPEGYGVISEQANANGTAVSTVPTSGHYDHLFGIGSYTIRRYEFFGSGNCHSELTDHPFVYADLAF